MHLAIFNISNVTVVNKYKEFLSIIYGSIDTNIRDS